MRLLTVLPRRRSGSGPLDCSESLSAAHTPESAARKSTSLFDAQGRTVRAVWTVLVILLVVWVVLSVVGFAFEGVLWLAIIGIVLFVGTLIFGIIRQRAKRTKA